MANRPGPTRARYTIWMERDTLIAWRALHDKRTNPANQHLERMIEAEISRLTEGEGEKGRGVAGNPATGA